MALPSTFVLVLVLLFLATCSHAINLGTEGNTVTFGEVAKLDTDTEQLKIVYHLPPSYMIVYKGCQETDGWAELSCTVRNVDLNNLQATVNDNSNAPNPSLVDITANLHPDIDNEENYTTGKLRVQLPLVFHMTRTLFVNPDDEDTHMACDISCHP